MIDLAQVAVGGLVVGCTYLLIGFSWNVVYNSCGYLNLAVGQVFVLTAVLADELSVRWPSAPVLAVSAATLAVVCAGGWLTERALLRPLGPDPLSPLMVTVGVALVLQEVSRALAPELVVRPAPFLPGPPVEVAGVIMSRQELLVLAVAAVTTAALLRFFHRTDLGRTFRATADDRAAAVAIGIDVRRVATAAFVASVALVGVAALVVAPVTGVAPGSGELVAIKSFLAVSIVGIGRYGAGAVAALAVGVAEALLARYADVDTRDLVVLGAFLVVLRLGVERRRGGGLGGWWERVRSRGSGRATVAAVGREVT